MILHRLEVEGFRCFAGKVSLELDPEAINVLHGPNASGKSSLLWALVRGLLDTHKAGGQAVKALRPWGTDLSPRITVEFDHGGVGYRLGKAFVEHRGARLEEKQGNKFIPIANNEKAEERVREMLLSEPPTVGLVKPEKWGLARVLWSPQENLRVDGLDGRVLGTIQGILGQQVLTDDALKLKAEVEELYQHYWTPGGKPVGGKNAPLHKRLEIELVGVREELTKAEAELEELRGAQEKAKTLQQERDTREKGLHDARAAATAWQIKADEYGPLAEERDKRKAVGSQAYRGNLYRKREQADCRSPRQINDGGDPS
jgi:DNA repair exonuclease SbcCD ATPase subunit